MKERFQKTKEMFFGPEPEPSELEYNKETSNFPAVNEGSEVTREEFRRVLEEQKPKEVYARYHFMDDFGSHGTFFVRLQDGSVIKVNDYYPPGDAEGKITKTANPVGVLDGLPYKEVLHKLRGPSLPLYFKAKFVLDDQTAT